MGETREQAERRRVWYSVTEDREFRDLLVGFMAETRSEFGHIRGALDDLKKDGCKQGQEDRALLRRLDESDGRQWKTIEKLKQPARKGALLGAGGLTIGAVIALVKQIWEALAK